MKTRFIGSILISLNKVYKKSKYTSLFHWAIIQISKFRQLNSIPSTTLVLKFVETWRLSVFYVRHWVCCQFLLCNGLQVYLIPINLFSCVSISQICYLDSAIDFAFYLVDPLWRTTMMWLFVLSLIYH